MTKEFKNISKVGFMLHNGGLDFKKISDDLTKQGQLLFNVVPEDKDD